MGAEGPRWTSGPGRHGEMGGKKKGKKGRQTRKRRGRENTREDGDALLIYTRNGSNRAGLPTLITRVVINALHGWGEVLGPRY